MYLLTRSKKECLRTSKSNGRSRESRNILEFYASCQLPRALRPLLNQRGAREMTQEVKVLMSCCKCLSSIPGPHSGERECQKLCSDLCMHTMAYACSHSFTLSCILPFMAPWTDSGTMDSRDWTQIIGMHSNSFYSLSYLSTCPFLFEMDIWSPCLHFRSARITEMICHTQHINLTSKLNFGLGM